MGLSLSKYVDSLQANGTYWFVKSRARTDLGLSSSAISMALQRLVQKRRIARPKSNFYVIVPIEHSSTACPPVPWFIDGLMKFLNRSYYVGILSAAAIHGAAHQRPYEFQVVTNRSLRPILVGRHRIRFFMRQGIEKVDTQRINTYTGTMCLSTPEETAFDLVRYMKAAGYLNNVATVLIELSEKLDPEKLLAVAKKNIEKVYVQRLGYLLDAFSEKKITMPLNQWMQKSMPKPTVLRPGRPIIKGAVFNAKWHVYVNETIEADL